MDNNQYLIKARINRCIADYSVAQGCYHVAVGRHYYHFFLLAKNHLISECNVSEDDFRLKTAHIQFRDLLRKALNDESWIGRVTADEINGILIYLEDLCKLRAKAEYTLCEFDENRYRTTCLGIVRKLDKMFTKFNFKESK